MQAASRAASPRFMATPTAATTVRAEGRATDSKRRKSAAASSSRFRRSSSPRNSIQISSWAGASSRARIRCGTDRLQRFARISALAAL